MEALMSVIVRWQNQTCLLEETPESPCKISCKHAREHQTETKSAEVCQVRTQEEVHAIDIPDQGMVCMRRWPTVQCKDGCEATTEHLLPQQQQDDPIQSMLEGRAISNMYC